MRWSSLYTNTVSISLILASSTTWNERRGSRQEGLVRHTYPPAFHTLTADGHNHPYRPCCRPVDESQREIPRYSAACAFHPARPTTNHSMPRQAIQQRKEQWLVLLFRKMDSQTTTKGTRSKNREVGLFRSKSSVVSFTVPVPSSYSF